MIKLSRESKCVDSSLRGVGYDIHPVYSTLRSDAAIAEQKSSTGRVAFVHPPRGGKPLPDWLYASLHNFSSVSATCSRGVRPERATPRGQPLFPRCGAAWGLRPAMPDLPLLPHSVSYAERSQSDTATTNICSANIRCRSITFAYCESYKRGCPRAEAPGLTGLRPPLKSTLLGQLNTLGRVAFCGSPCSILASVWRMRKIEDFAKTVQLCLVPCAIYLLFSQCSTAINWRGPRQTL